jgi:hypothetical protein
MSAARRIIGAALYVKARLRKVGCEAGVPYAWLLVTAGRALLLALLAACALIAGGCGSGSEDTDKPPAVARPEDFPTASGKTLQQLRQSLPDGGPVLAPAVSQLTVGVNRFGFGLFDRGRNQIADAQVAVYAAPVGGGRASGPFIASWESLKVDSPFQSQTVKSDPDAARSVYVADLKLPRAGQYEILGVARLDDRLVAATSAGPPMRVLSKARDRVPAVGQPAPRVHTPTKADVGGDVAKIDTRVPPDTMHDVDLADVLGKRPVVLVFATPLLCQSRVCGPVVDIAEQVKADLGDKAAFIHMEIYADNEVDKGFRPQVRQWRLPSEPWVFTIDRQGRIATRIEGAFSADELKAAVQRAVKG